MVERVVRQPREHPGELFTVGSHASGRAADVKESSF
jgi:hypothetical protein